MRFRLGLIIMFFVVFNTMAQEKKDDYSIPVVKNLLQQPEGFSTGFSDKQLDRLGDRISIALIKIFSEQELKDPQRIRKVLPLIRQAFNAPNVISVAEDKSPKVTMLLLRFWLSEVADTSLKNDISQLITALKGKGTT